VIEPGLSKRSSLRIVRPAASWLVKVLVLTTVAVADSLRMNPTPLGSWRNQQ